MFGGSVYLTGFETHTQLWEEAEVYFTSFHIAEEFSPDYAGRIKALLDFLKENKKTVIADISPRGVTAAGYCSLAEFAERSGADVVRCDYGFSREEMAEVAKYASLAFNASTASGEEAAVLQEMAKYGYQSIHASTMSEGEAAVLQEMAKYGYQSIHVSAVNEGQMRHAQETVADLVAIHNFYPRPETGLDEDFLLKKNVCFHQMGIRTAAFISGDLTRRGPLYEGLPTLERHRNAPPYLQYLELRRSFETDLVLSGDPGISQGQRRLIGAYERDGVICVPARLQEEYRNLYGKIWTVRPDSPHRVARLAESREYATAGRKLEAVNCVERPAGSITMDNEHYLRYSGEIQIVREALPACERVNVIGQIAADYLGLAELLDGGTRMRFVDAEPL